MKELQGSTAFVTGGSGFIGGRLIESLVLDYGVKVRALVNRPFAGALRMARFPIEFIHAPMTDCDSMTKAMKGCDFVFHLAYAKSGSEKEQYRITVNGTKALVDAATTNRVTRFVNVSTAAVYGNAVNGVIDETARRKRWGWSYSDMKLDAEDIVLHAHKSNGFPGTVIQVAGVYGPWGSVFTVTPLIQMQTGQVGLVNQGKGISNATFVDDAVQGLLLAALNPASEGEIFILKGPGTITRHEFMKQYDKMLNLDSLVLLTEAEYRAHLSRKRRSAIATIMPAAISSLKHSAEFRKAISLSGLAPIARLAKSSFSRGRSTSTNRATVPRDVQTSKARELFLPPPFYARYLSAETQYSSKKAQEILGYTPAYNLEDGMTVTEQWARWARVIAPSIE